MQKRDLPSVKQVEARLEQKEIECRIYEITSISKEIENIIRGVKNFPIKYEFGLRDSTLELLKTKGYTVNPIPNQEYGYLIDIK